MTASKLKLIVPKTVSDVSLALSSAGYQNYLVGGCVRDSLMGRTPKDWDITTNATPEQIMALFPHTFYENEYGTVGVVNDEEQDEALKTVEVTPFRIAPGRHLRDRRPQELRSRGPAGHAGARAAADEPRLCRRHGRDGVIAVACPGR